QDDFAARPAFDRAACLGGGDDGPASSKDLPGQVGFFAGANQDVHLIPDGGASGVSSPIAVTGVEDDSVGLVNLRLAIAHGWRGELTVRLTSPSGETRDVVSFDPSDSSDDVDGIFLVPLYSPGVGDGTWTLTVVDSAA